MLPAPSPSTTPCAVATPATVAISWPDAPVRISSSSAANFAHFNHDGHGSILVLVRYDGTKDVLIPPTRDIDAALAARLSDYAGKIAVAPTVACGQFVGLFLVRFDVPSGVVHHVLVRPPAPARANPSPPSAPPAPAAPAPPDPAPTV